MKIQLAKLSRQLTVHGRNGSSNAIVLKMTPMLWQLLQRFSCVLLPAAASVELTHKHAPSHSAFPGTRRSHGGWEMPPYNTTSGQSYCWAPPRAQLHCGSCSRRISGAFCFTIWFTKGKNLLVSLLQEGKKRSGEAITFSSSHHSAAN